MAYTGKHDLRVTARCPHCGATTEAEMDYEHEKDSLGKTVAEIIPEIPCSRCAKTVFKRSRFDLTLIGEEPMEEPKEKPKSIVLEVQSLRHVMQTQFQPTEAVKPREQEEQNNGEKH